VPIEMSGGIFTRRNNRKSERLLKTDGAKKAERTNSGKRSTGEPGKRMGGPIKGLTDLSGKGNEKTKKEVNLRPGQRLVFLRIDHQGKSGRSVLQRGKREKRIETAEGGFQGRSGVRWGGKRRRGR